MALSNWHFKKNTLAAVQKKIIEELSSSSRELHPAWKGLSCLPAVSLLLISHSLPLAAQATSFFTCCTCACPPICWLYCSDSVLCLCPL